MARVLNLFTSLLAARASLLRNTKRLFLCVCASIAAVQKWDGITPHPFPAPNNPKLYKEIASDKRKGPDE